MCARLRDAYRTPTRDAYSGETDPNAAESVERRLEIERAQRRRDLSTASRSWEREPADPVEAVTGAANKLERERRRIHSEFSQRLENSWKSPVGHM
jgi:hypothetical protein